MRNRQGRLENYFSGFPDQHFQITFTEIQGKLTNFTWSEETAEI